jgi:hypothetical protein
MSPKLHISATTSGSSQIKTTGAVNPRGSNMYHISILKMRSQWLFERATRHYSIRQTRDLYMSDTNSHVTVIINDGKAAGEIN